MSETSANLIGSDLIAASGQGLVRLRAVADSLPASDLQRRLHGEWTVSAALAHMAFWDCWVQQRWLDYERRGAFETFPDSIADLINASALDIWLAVSPARAVGLALEASANVSATIERLPPAAVNDAIGSGRVPMLNRTRHWNEHLDQIESSV